MHRLGRSGHVHQLLAVAQALQARGHGVARVTATRARPTGEGAGATCLPQVRRPAHDANRTVRGDTAGNIAARSFMCASPSLRIMLWPISVFISPAGWCDEKMSMRFSCEKMSSRRVNTVEPSCGTKAIGASCRIFASAG